MLNKLKQSGWWPQPRTDSDTLFTAVWVFIGLTVAGLLLQGCAFLQSKPVQDTYTGVHELRLGIEAIPGVVPLVDNYAPWAPAARLGLNGLYLLDRTALQGLQVNVVAPVAQATTPTAGAQP